MPFKLFIHTQQNILTYLEHLIIETYLLTMWTLSFAINVFTVKERALVPY